MGSHPVCRVMNTDVSSHELRYEHTSYVVKFQGRIQDFRKGGAFICRAASEDNFSPLFISYQDAMWHFVLCTASSRCKRLQDPRGRHVLPFLAQISLTQYVRTCKYTRSLSRSQAVRFQPGVAM